MLRCSLVPSAWSSALWPLGKEVSRSTRCGWEQSVPRQPSPCLKSAFLCSSRGAHVAVGWVGDGVLVQRARSGIFFLRGLG